MTSILAWTVVVDSALLNERFLQDMKATCAAKGCPAIPEGGVCLFLPHPPPDVCQIFNDYVRCRWPLHVFAIDPETEDQNIGDAFSLRREMQLALALGFTNGKIGARSFTRYTRRIEQDIETIALNRTIIGFSHGDNIFGWRFYPRVQTPPIDGNLQAVFRDLLYGGYGPNYYLRRRRLENGIRECVALVIMPSFVPYVDLAVTGNWFRLAHPKCKELDLKDVMRLSRSVQTIQSELTVSCDNGCYRPGDVSLMQQRLEQLAARLPLQQQLVSVPYENTHGGFELLSGGVTVLAPELNGWYGAPGIDPTHDTALFLVGDNFSVHGTRVIVGGKWLDPACQVCCSNQSSCPEVTGAPVAGQTQTSQTSTATMTQMKTSGSAPSTSMATPKDVPIATNPQHEEPPAEVVPAGGPMTRWFNRCNTQPVVPPVTSVNVLNQLPVPLVTPPSAAAAAAAMKAADAKSQAADATMKAASAKADTADAKTSAASGDQTTAGQKSASADQKASAATQQAQQASDTASQAKAMAEAVINPVTDVRFGVPHFQIELLSRQIMRIVIPAGVFCKSGLVDIHIATPYGVSPALQVPVLCETCPSPQAQPAQPVAGYKVDDKADTIKVSYKFEKVGGMGKKLSPTLCSSGKDAKFGFVPTVPIGAAPKSVNAVFVFKGSKGPLPVTYSLTGNNDRFELKGDQLDAFVKKIVDTLKAAGNEYSQANPLPALESTSITFATSIPGASGLASATKIPVTGSIKIQFEYWEDCPPREKE